MQGDVSVELLKEWNPVTNQDGHDRIANFVGQPEAKAFGGNGTTPDKPDAAKRGPQAAIHELREIAPVELDRVPRPGQVSARENERGFVAVRPPEPLGFESK